jgi:hypothetical protein
MSIDLFHFQQHAGIVDCLFRKPYPKGLKAVVSGDNIDRSAERDQD